MSGVYGIVAPEKNGAELDVVAGDMRNALTHYSWYVNDLYSDREAGVFLGRVGIGVFNQARQPIHSESGYLSAVFCGEFTHVDVVRSALRQDGVQLRNDTDEELLLACYEKWGANCVAQLQGQFVFAIWDRRRDELILANDRFGLYPTYYTESRGRLLFAPEIKSLLSDATIPRKLRNDALAEYFRFQRLLGTKTFFADIHLLPAASILCFDLRSGDYKVSRYWDIGQSLPRPVSITLNEAIEEGARRLMRAIEEAMRGPWPIGAFLSGGFDSRMLVGLLAKKGCAVQTFTFGRPGCRDEYYARQIARAINVPHHFYPYHNGHWIEQFAEMHVRLTEGFHSWLHMHGINMLGDVRQHIAVNVSGLGDLLWPDHNFTPTHLLAAPDNVAFASIFFELYHQKYSWPGLTYADERTLYAESYRRQLVGLAYDSFMAELTAYDHLPLATKAIAFNLDNHFSRHLLYHCVFGRSHLEYRLPYFDLDLLTFAYGLPPQISMERRVQKGIIAQYLPQVARIPATTDDLPITINESSMKVAKLFKEVRRQATRFVAPHSVERTSLYADYEGWLRTDLRSWAESILFDERTQDRGIFCREALVSLWARHMTGNELWTIGKIASIITFEMTLRSFNL